MSDPHAGQLLLRAGPELAAARGVLILLHGRGGNAAEILDFAGQVAGPGFACLAPQAAMNTWWPGRFMEPVQHNEPFLSSALAVVGRLVAEAVSAGTPASRVALLGFSQGACLATEFLYRSATPLGAVVGCSGGLIGEAVGPAGPATLAATPVLLSCSERDPHIPLARVVETGAALRGRGADVATHTYPGSSHTITRDEIDRARTLMAAMAEAG